MGLEGGLPLVASCDTYVVVANTVVKLGVYFSTAQLVEKVGDESDWVAILLGDFVQVPEVHTESEGAIPFLGTEDGGTGW